MKNKDTISAIVGASFFAIPYLALAVPIIPSLAIGAGAFVAGEMVFKNKESTKLKDTNYNLYKTIENAKKQNKHILDMKKNIDTPEISNCLIDIYETTSKIIETIEKEPKKLRIINNFFDYYLPVTVSIIDRYDNIENQRLSSKESYKFFKSTNEMLLLIRDSFKKMLNSLYENEIMDTDADMKVLNSMLKSDGFNADEIIVKEEKDG